MTERVAAWCCIGCGRVEAPRPCIGVCQDRQCELVSSTDYNEAVAEIDALRALVRRLAWTTPRDGDWERSYRALQQQARVAMGSANAS